MRYIIPPLVIKFYEVKNLDKLFIPFNSVMIIIKILYWPGHREINILHEIKLIQHTYISIDFSF